MRQVSRSSFDGEEVRKGRDLTAVLRCHDVSFRPRFFTWHSCVSVVRN